jgi:hypothetical protein
VRKVRRGAVIAEVVGAFLASIVKQDALRLRQFHQGAAGRGVSPFEIVAAFGVDVVLALHSEP